MFTWAAHSKAVISLAFAPDSRRLVTGGADGRVAVWGVGSDAALLVRKDRIYNQVAFTSDGRFVVTNGDETVDVWDGGDGGHAASLSVAGHSPSFALVPGGKLLATYSNVEFLSNALEFFATDDWSRIDVWEDMSPSGGNWLGFSPDGRFLALPSHQQMTVWAVGVGKKAVVASHDLPNTGTTVAAFSPDGRFLVCGAGRRLAILTCPGFARVADLASRRHHWRSIAFHPTGRYFAAVGNDVVVTVYDTTTWAVSKSFAWDIGKLRSIAFSPDGCLAAVGSDTGKIVVWDVDF